MLFVVCVLCYVSSIAGCHESRRAHESEYRDLLERSQIFYRRLVALGEAGGLDPPRARARSRSAHGPNGLDQHHPDDDDDDIDEEDEDFSNIVRIGSLDKSRARSLMRAGAVSSKLGSELEGETSRTKTHESHIDRSRPLLIFPRSLRVCVRFPRCCVE